VLRRPLRLLLPVLVVAGVLLLVAGAWVGGRHPGWLPGALGGDRDTAVVNDAIDEVHRAFFRKIPRDQLANEAIAGLVARLGDRFSHYFDPAEYRRYKDSREGQFSGVGLEVSQDPRGLRVQAVYDGSPAKRAGLRVGDVIVAVDGRSLAGVAQDTAVADIQGPPGSSVRLTWLRGRQRVTRLLTRSTVTVPVVASELRTAASCRIGVARLSQFSSGAHAELYAALQRLKARGAKAFVLDLRANGGGLITEARLVASAFLTDGTIVTTRGRSTGASTLRATGDPVVPSAPLVVLVDGGTASASEIVAGALQDRHRARVVGTRTFGKGVFEEVIELSNGGALVITAGQYFTPSGRNLGGKGVVARGAGISPDVSARDDPKTVRDEGLDGALQAVGTRCPR
jgi:carboxyl-terminal processing protease